MSTSNISIGGEIRETTHLEHQSYPYNAVPVDLYWLIVYIITY